MATSESIPTFFAPGAFAAMRLMGDVVAYDTRQLQQFSDMAQEQVQEELPPLDDTTFIFRYAAAGYEQPRRDPQYARANPGDCLFVPAKQLTLPDTQAPTPYTKAHVTATSGNVLEVTMNRFDTPLIHELATSLAWPPPEDVSLIPTDGNFWGAWGRFAKNIVTGPSEGQRRHFRDEAVRQFSGAIVLKSIA